MDPNIAGALEARSPASTGEVERLIVAGKCKQAVELAKTDHKRLNTPASEKSLVDAYLARIEQFQNKGATQDAQTLLDLVRQRFPTYQGRLGDLSLKSAAAQGNVDVLVAPLARDDVPPEQRALIESALRRTLTDLPRLANCASLPPGHPLRVGAAALHAAFTAVTTEPVTDEQIALPEISRQSPLADWKLLIRAMAAFYRNADDLCRRNLATVPPDSAVRRMADVLLAVIDQTPPAAGRSGALQSRIFSDDRRLRIALEQLDAGFQSRYYEILQSAIRSALEVCAAVRPELLETLRQRISVRCAIEDVPVEEVLKLMGSSRKDSNFWRLLARSAEMQQTPQAAAALWDRFRVHGIAERLFTAGSMEEAAIKLHAAALLAQAFSMPGGDVLLFRYLRDYYRNQPDDIAALQPKSLADVDAATDANRLFRQVVEIDPHSPAFMQWHAWAMGTRLPEKQVQELAELWHRKLPADPKPLLMLSQAAEDRKALKLATRYLSQAEAVDPMNPAARKARVRLTLATAWKHFTDRKPHLVQQDIELLSALPAMSEGDRPALLETMRAAWHAIAGSTDAAQAAADRAAALAGPLLAPCLLRSVKALIRHPLDGPPRLDHPESPDELAIAQAESRLIRLTRETLVPIHRPISWNALIKKVLSRDPCPLSEAALLDLASQAVNAEDSEQAYRASSAGLTIATGSNPAWFLLYRAQSLPEWAGRRAAQCLRAALELSRHANDPELAARIADQIDRCPEAQAALNSKEGRSLGGELLEKVLQSERSARHYPRNQLDAERHVVALAVPTGFGGFGAMNPFDDDPDDFDDEDDFDPSDPDDLPTGVTPDMIDKIFRNLGNRKPKKGERIDPRLIGEVAAMLGAMMQGMDDPDQDTEPSGPSPKPFGRRKRKKP